MYAVFLFFHATFSLYCYSCADAHKIILNLSSSETLNRIKDNKLEISGWTIYDCGDFTRKERHSGHAHRFKYHRMNIWIMRLWSKQHRKNKKTSTIGISEEMNKWRNMTVIRCFGLSTAIINISRSLLYNVQSFDGRKKEEKTNYECAEANTTSQIVRIMITFNGLFSVWLRLKRCLQLVDECRLLIVESRNCNARG